MQTVPSVGGNPHSPLKRTFPRWQPQVQAFPTVRITLACLELARQHTGSCSCVHMQSRLTRGGFTHFAICRLLAPHTRGAWHFDAPPWNGIGHGFGLRAAEQHETDESIKGERHVAFLKRHRRFLPLPVSESRLL